MVYHNSTDFKIEKFFSTLEKIEFNGHAYISGDYETKESKLVVYCKTHQIEHCTTFTNYCRSRTGMPCCGKSAVSKKLSDRKYSPETLEKMSQAALNRAKISSGGQDWRRSTEAREWEKKVKELWDNKCPITGKEAGIVMHHFFSGARGKTIELRDALLYNSINGILLAKDLHVDFHKEFGYQENTIEQFQSYVKNLEKLISSQAQQECWEGSETRVNDPTLIDTLLQSLNGVKRKVLLERIMKLHERLEEINKELRNIIIP